MRYLLFIFMILLLVSCNKNTAKQDFSNIINKQSFSSNNQQYNFIKIRNSDVIINIPSEGRYRLKSTTILKYNDYVKSDFSLSFPPLSVLSLDVSDNSISSKSSFDKLNFSIPSTSLNTQTFQSILIGQVPPLYSYLGKKEFDYDKTIFYKDSSILFSLFDSTSVASYKVDIDTCRNVNKLSMHYNNLSLSVSYSNYSLYNNLVIPSVINITFVSKDYNIDAYIKRRDIMLLDSI